MESWSGILEFVLEWNKVRFFVVVVHLFKNVNLGNSESFCSIILLINESLSYTFRKPAYTYVKNKSVDQLARLIRAFLFTLPIIWHIFQ